MPGVRFHGRGGQGVVTAAELLAAAAFSEGAHAQAFPSGLPIVMTVANRAIGAPINIWNDHSGAGVRPRAR